MDIDKIDLSPLEKPFNKADYPLLGKQKGSTLAKKQKQIHLYIIISIFIIAILSLISLGSESGEEIPFYIVPIGVAVVLIGQLIVMIRKYLKIKRYIFYLQALANDNSLDFYDNYKLEMVANDARLQQFSAGILFGIRGKKVLTHCVANDKLFFGNYQYLPPYQDDRSKIIEFSLAILTLPKNLPHIFIASKNKKAPHIINFMIGGLSKRQLVNAESALVDNFDLYALENFEIDSLSFIAPDVIDVLTIDFSTDDIEIVSNKLFIYSMRIVDDNQSLKKQLMKLQNLAKVLFDNVKNYQSKAITHQIVSGPQFSQDITNYAGKRLKRSFWGRTIMGISIKDIVMFFIKK